MYCTNTLIWEMDSSGTWLSAYRNLLSQFVFRCNKCENCTMLRKENTRVHLRTREAERYFWQEPHPIWTTVDHENPELRIGQHFKIRQNGDLNSKKNIPRFLVQQRTVDPAYFEHVQFDIRHNWNETKKIKISFSLQCEETCIIRNTAPLGGISWKK